MSGQLHNPTALALYQPNMRLRQPSSRTGHCETERNPVRAGVATRIFGCPNRNLATVFTGLL